MIKSLILYFLSSLILMASSCGEKAVPNEHQEDTPKEALDIQNLHRAIMIADNAFTHYFTGEDMAMARFYNPYTQVRSQEKGSVWMYTSAIEAVNAILSALKTQQAQGQTALYDTHFERYTGLLQKLFDNLAYYQGTFQLTSFTQTREWSVYGVHRAAQKGTAQVAGIENVYDDQQWLVRELLHSYRLIGDKRFLEKAEYLTEYILDGWDSTRDGSGQENGGIPWGPGYTTKHACSNGPFVSPLVWLHEHYLGSEEEITYRYIAPDQKREVVRMKKSEYYLKFAEDIYLWQKERLLREDGVYDDFLGGCGSCKVAYEIQNGIPYRTNTPLTERVGPAYSYNAGAMLSGGVDLYRTTKKENYARDLQALADNSFKKFAKRDAQLPGYYSYNVAGFNNWFNGVLMRAFVEAQPVYPNTDQYIQTFQQNLDHGYAHSLEGGILAPDLLGGWNEDNRNVEGMFAFTFAAEYALLSEYVSHKQHSVPAGK